METWITGVCVTTTSTGHVVDEGSMIDWFEDCFLPACPNRPAILIMDVWYAHTLPSVVNLCIENNIHTNIIPPDRTGQLQVLDTHVNKTFRAEYLKQMCKDIADAMASETGGDGTTCGPN
jgi:hypothetical protein